MASAGFRFDRVLRLKRLLRRAAQDEVAALRRDIVEVEDGISAAELARDESRARLVEAARAGSMAADLQVHASYERAQAAAARAFRARVVALGELLDQRRAILMERRREERQFEVLRERQERRDVEAAGRTEASFQDELALRRVARERRTRSRVASRDG